MLTDSRHTYDGPLTLKAQEFEKTNANGKNI